MEPGRTHQAFLEVVRETLRERGLELAVIDLDLPLTEEGLGLDSISRLTLLSSLESKFGIEFPEEYWGAKTFRDLRAILSHLETAHG